MFGGQGAKKTTLDNYDIFTVIAENTGYDATGKPTGNNELDFIDQELKIFIEHVWLNHEK